MLVTIKHILQLLTQLISITIDKLMWQVTEGHDFEDMNKRGQHALKNVLKHTRDIINQWACTRIYTALFGSNVLLQTQY